MNDIERYVWSAYARAYAPDPHMNISEWADQNRVLSTETSAEAGQWRTERTPYLREIMDCLSPGTRVDQVCVMSGAQVGKALSLDTEILTISGWKTMRDIHPGDFVFAPDGTPTLVTGISAIMKNHKCYDVEFSDKTIIRADAEHLWTVIDASIKNKKNKIITKRTSELLADGIKFRSNRYKYVIPAAKPLQSTRSNLLLDPYILGVWLGDGNSMSPHITQSFTDAEELAGNLCARGCLVYIVKAERNTTTIKLDPIMESTTVFSKLRKLKLVGNKHIPGEYLIASFDDRLDLLRGLMDTDGTVTTEGLVEYCSTVKDLSDGVYFLAASLGYVPKIKRRQGTPVGLVYGNVIKTCQPYYIVEFTAYSEINPFSLSRKADRLKSKNTPGLRPTQTFSRRIVSILPAPSVPVKCIAVAHSSNLYLATRALIATHNTECGNNFTGFNVDKAPGPMLYVLPTLDMIKDCSKTRIDPMIAACPSLREKVQDPRSRDSGNSMFMKEFPGGYLAMTGANSAASLRSKPIRYLYLDEIDAFPGDVEGEGDPVHLAIARTRNFGNRKILMTSTPTIAGHSRIEDVFWESDRRRYYVPCPHCGAMQILRWEHVKWNHGDPTGAWYECEACGEKIFNHEKEQMLPRGEWRPDVKNYKGHIAGFQISSLYSPVGWFSWGDAAEMFEKSARKPEKLKVFVNTVLGETFEERGEAPEWKDLYFRRELYPRCVVPDGGLFLTAGADVQKNRIEVEIVAWGREKETWSVDYRVLMGDTADSENGPWRELGRLLNEGFEHENGTVLHIRCLAVDTGYDAQTVYNWARNYPAGRVMPVKGRDAMSVMVNNGTDVDVKMQKTGKKIGRIRLWNVGVSLIKSELYGWLKLKKAAESIKNRVENDENGDISTENSNFNAENDKNTSFSHKTSDFPPGFAHFPDYPEEWFEQLCAETLVIHELKNGRKSFEWVKIRDRNEALDCRVYARAAAALLRIDMFRGPEWARLEQAVAPKQETNDQRAEAAPTPQVQRSTSRPVRGSNRRVGTLSRGVRL